MSTAVTVDAPAKVNLALQVGPLRPDGYHDVTTVMLTVGLADTLVAASGEKGITLERDPEPDFPAQRDLVVRAVSELAAATGREATLALSLEKRIPIAAGLGGGSADAAAALVACCALWGLDPGAPVVLSVAGALGADVPFMLRGGCALYTGRGDVPVAELETPDLDIVLTNAGFAVPTADVYRAFDALGAPSVTDARAAAEGVATGGRGAILAALANDLTGAARQVAPAIGEVLDALAARPGVLGALLAGSGGTVFGIARDAEAASAAAAALAARGWWAVATSTRGPRDGDQPARLRVY